VVWVDRVLDRVG
jgi:hypothetical protein